MLSMQFTREAYAAVTPLILRVFYRRLVVGVVITVKKEKKGAYSSS